MKIIEKDCIEYMKSQKSSIFDMVITSPPYNLNIQYGTYKDNRPRENYLLWIEEVFQQVKRVLKENGSLFLNMGCSNVDPWIPMDVANTLRPFMTLQNQIMWIKSLAINGNTYGHFKPINSSRFLNHTYEYLFHFTKTGNVPINRSAIGVPYTDKTNIKRWGKKEDLHCRGNTWHIPYETIQNKSEKGNHPATYPVELVEWCIKLHGVNKDSLIYDPFLGTGTTLKAAENIGIDGIGTDVDKEYIDYSKRRLS
jgi:site-specific DNA-methyltransferase (adenine-specific)